MKFLSIICFFIGTSIACAQVTDSVDVGFYKSVYLIFDDSPETVDAGSEHLSVRVQDNKVILQILDADQWEPTTLFVENNGFAYVFLIDYKEDIKRFIYNYSQKTSAPTVTSKGNSTQSGSTNDSLIAEEKVIIMPSYQDLMNKEKEKNIVDSMYLVNCLDVIGRDSRLGNKGVIKYKMGYYLRDLVVINDKCYLRFEIINRSNINFSRDIESYNVINVKRRIKGSSEQIIRLEPIYQYNVPSEFKGKSTYEYVVVVDKFVLTKDKKLQLQLWEQNGLDLDEEGGRKLSFDLFYDDVINATN